MAKQYPSAADNAAEIPPPPPGITLQTVDEFLGFKAAGQENGREQSHAVNVPKGNVDTAPAPAAPDTPWTDAFCKRFERDMSMPEDSIERYARSLERLVHQQHEALLKVGGAKLSDGTYIDKDAGIVLTLAAYAALAKEIERG